MSTLTLHQLLANYWSKLKANWIVYWHYFPDFIALKNAGKLELRKNRETPWFMYYVLNYMIHVLNYMIHVLMIHVLNYILLNKNSVILNNYWLINAKDISIKLDEMWRLQDIVDSFQKKILLEKADYEPISSWFIEIVQTPAYVT